MHVLPNSFHKLNIRLKMILFFVAIVYLHHLNYVVKKIYKIVFCISIASYIKVCNRKDPEINKCVLNSIEQLRDKLTTGIPELSVPPIEPLILNHIRLLRGPNGARLDVNLTNLQVGIKLNINIVNIVNTFSYKMTYIE